MGFVARPLRHILLLVVLVASGAWIDPAVSGPPDTGPARLLQDDSLVWIHVRAHMNREHFDDRH